MNTITIYLFNPLKSVFIRAVKIFLTILWIASLCTWFFPLAILVYILTGNNIFEWWLYPMVELWEED